MKINRIITYSALSLITLSTVSCSRDLLDRKPLGQATDGDLNVGGAETKIFGLYSQLRTEGGVADWTRFWFQSIRSDDAQKGSIPAEAAVMGGVMDNFKYSATEGIANNNWNGHYKLIYACNDVIAEIEAVANPDAAKLANLGEAKAIRGWAFFELKRDYGEIPLVLNRVVNPQDAIKAKSTIQEVDAQIKKDLTDAAAVLPARWDQAGRCTKGMANAYLAKLALYQKDWATALAKSEEVINSGVYSLYASYPNLFLSTANNSSEGIFEIQLARISKVDYSNNYWESQGVRGSGEWNLGWGFNVPTTDLVNAYEANDPRKAATILYSGQDDGYGKILPASPPLSQPYWNKKAYTDPARRLAEGQNANKWTNIKVMRYADVLLIAAEAANELGQTGKAVKYINEVRNRVKMPALTVSDQASVRTAIKYERRVEFAMEGERFYDLVRWGDAPSVLGTLGYQNKNEFYPIPQTAIDQSGGVLKQNPNY